MSATVPLMLNRGLDYVTPPLLAEPGTLVEAINYEIASSIGYRRCDGYERVDGWHDGGVSSYYTATATPQTVGEELLVVPGSLLYRGAGFGASNFLGVIVEYNSTTGLLTYVPTGSGKAFVSGTTFSFLLDQEENFLVDQGDENLLFQNSAEDVVSSGSATALIRPPGDPNFYLFDLSPSIAGRDSAASPEAYLNNLRAYSFTLRTLVTQTSSPIAGVHYARDTEYLVLDAPSINMGEEEDEPAEGSKLLLGSTVYRYMGRHGAGDDWVWALMPIDTSDFDAEGHLLGMNAAVDASTFDWGEFAGEISNTSYLGYMVRANNWAKGDVSRGYTPLTPAYMFSFEDGEFTGGSIDSPEPPLTGLGAGSYWLVSNGGLDVLEVRLNQVVQYDGVFASGDASGIASFTVLAVEDGDTDVPVMGGVLHSEYPTTGTSAIMTVSTAPKIAKLAGTLSLVDRQEQTRYQWGTYNFYGNSTLRQYYGVNGVFRAFWGDFYTYGNIYTQADETLDNPKYLTFHAGVQLGLGFDLGSLQLSVGGVPYNFNGAQGALEITTGDDITGLLESANDSTLVFGRRSIRRVTGTTDSDLQLGTISANAGALNYTAVNVGSIPVFTGPTGVSTLEQSNVYGDFIGNRATTPIYTWLNPRLTTNSSVIEAGGVACAFAVRDKQQYRLILNTGDVVSVTFTQEGPKIMKSNWGLEMNDIRVPLAWSSQVSDAGAEQIHIVWDAFLAEQGTRGVVGNIPARNQLYKMDYGWGYDGSTFTHFFDLAWTFVNNGAQATRIEKIRMHGMGYGVATLDAKSSSIEKDFDQPFSERIQSINMPYETKMLYETMRPITGIVDHQNWGYGIKLRINGTTGASTSLTEPAHICQVMVLYLDEPGAKDA